MKTSSSLVITVILGVIIGFLVWALSPRLTGFKEPWDAAWPFYSIVIFLTGMVFTLIRGRVDAIGFLGLWVGQILGLLIVQGASWLGMGIISTLVFGAINYLPGSILGFLLLKTTKRSNAV